MPSSIRRQKGVVLILAMLIVVLVTSIVVSLSWRYNLSLTRSENRWHGLQAQAYLEGAETLAKFALAEDARQDQEQGKNTDNLQEYWAQQHDPFPTDEGWVQATIEDAQGRFNINLLQKPAQQPPDNGSPQSVPLLQRFTESQKRFIRLLQTFEFEEGIIDQSEAIAITEAVIDWVDLDQNVNGFGGAEIDYYQQLDPPTTPPDQAMVSVSELRQVKGITPQLYQALLPLVVALPPDAGMNINTAPLALLRTLAGKDDLMPLTVEDAQLLMEERAGMSGGADTPMAPPADQDQGLQMQAVEFGFDNINALKQSPVLSTLVNSTGGLDTTDLAVQSNYFLLFGQVQVGEQTRNGSSLLRRQNDLVRVIRRTDANF